MAKRRRLTGKPLLVASTAMAFAACGTGKGGMVTGNLMPPPMPEMVEVCVDTTPASAVVVLDGVTAEQRCTAVEMDGSVVVDVQAPGFEPDVQEHALGGPLELKVELAEMVPLPPPDMPVGNLMPPPDIVPPGPPVDPND